MAHTRGLTLEQRNRLRNKVSTETLNATLDLLGKFGKCMVIRPTGFGKSYMLAKLTNNYNRSLYVYPLNIIKTAVLEDYGENGKNGTAKLHNTEFISYSALNNKYKDGTVAEYLSKFNLVMLDECHMSGADGFMTIYSETYHLFDRDKVHLVGVTATPNRANKTQLKDGTELVVNVLQDIFDGHKIFPFTLKNCFETGLMMKPRYVEILYDTDGFRSSVKNKLSKNTKKLEKSLNTAFLKEEHNKLLADLAKMIDNIDNAPTQIKKVIDDERGRHPNYLKFITFCRNRTDIGERQSKISTWFREAYPEYKVEDHIIVSKSGGVGTLDYEDEIESVEKLKDIQERDNTIDIIYCVDMLNMGYHVDNIDGVLLMRSTQSQIVYLQQIGRCMSVKSNKRPIILDFVRNVEMNFFKDDKEENILDENGNIIELDKEESDDTILTKEDMFIAELEDGTGALLSKIDEAMASILSPEDRLANKVIWWYTQMSAPIFIILRLIEKPLNQHNVDSVVRILMNSGIRLESEEQSLLVLNKAEIEALKSRQAYLDLLKKAIRKVNSEG